MVSFPLPFLPLAPSSLFVHDITEDYSLNERSASN